MTVSKCSGEVINKDKEYRRRSKYRVKRVSLAFPGLFEVSAEVGDCWKYGSKA